MQGRVKNLLVFVILAIGLIAYLYEEGGREVAGGGRGASPRRDGGELIAEAFRTARSDVQVEGRGVVARLLADDSEGSRHQRFILRLDNGQTVLVAHNIDVASRIDGLRTGDTVVFYGEYEWTAKGGVIHWTHHDPAGRHADGWLRHDGRTYR